MSDDMEDSDVILIAPQTKNQDGSQTFYILDPCTSSSDEPPGIEIIDLTAEVKNTGAIAVLSTNSNTGALEITLTRDQLKLEAMDSPADAEKIQVNCTTSACPSENEISDDDLANCVIKDEDEEVDVEEISLNDVQVESGDNELKSESSENIETSEGIDYSQNEQDDEPEEGVLYIDDAKFPELQEPPEENVEEIKSFEGVENEEKVNMENINMIKNSDFQEAKHFSEEINSSLIENEEYNINCKQLQPDRVSIDRCGNAINEETPVQEALIHGHVFKMPSEKQCLVDQSAEKEYVESTNTALTLLELAGGTSYGRSSVSSNSSEIEVIELEQTLNPSPVHLVPSDNTPLESESATLTTLQPVPIDPLNIESSTTEHLSKDNTHVINYPNNFSASSTSPTLQKKPELSSSTPKIAGCMKVSNDMVQRLIEGDTPMLAGLRGSKTQYKHLSPLVTQDDIAKEILERSMQKCPYTEPSGGDVIFAMKLAHRLASRIVTPEKPPIAATEKTSVDKPELTMPSVTKSFNNAPASKHYVAEKTERNKSQQEKYDAISDKIELLKILEDDPDDIPDLDQNQLIEQRTKIKKSKTLPSPLIKLHPELEKELALRQLQDFSQTARKKKVGFIHQILKKTPKQEKKMLKNDHEHNNNVNANKGDEMNLTKRRNNEASPKSPKRFKKEAVDSAGVTVDPSQITETLTIEGQDLIQEQSKDIKSLKQYSNKRLSRNSETPPREVPMEILLNGIDDEDSPADGMISSKNKIFKATNPKKRQEELRRKRQKHFANVLQRNKPPKKRGRPPKKKHVLPPEDMLNLELLHAKIIENIPKPPKGNNSHEICVPDKSEEIDSLASNDKPQKTKKMREIERLLGDEGAINMLYSVEQKRTTGSEPKRGMLPSYRRKKKDLILKTKLVKSAVLRLTNSPPQALGRVSLRGQANKDEENEENAGDISLRKISIDSHDSHHSLSSPPDETFPFPAKIVPAEASRIIRRHSSSSNYSSRSNSPRRPSIDSDRISIITPDIKTSEVGQGDAPLSIKLTKTSKSSQQTTGSMITKKIAEKCENVSLDKSSELNPSQKSTIETKKVPSQTVPSGSCKSKVKIKSEKLHNLIKKTVNRPRRKMSQEEMKKNVALNTSLADAMDDFTKEIENIDKNIPVETPKKLSSSCGGANTRRSTSKVAVYRKSGATVSRLRADKPSIVYNELTLKRHNHLVEIILAPVSTKLKNALSVSVLRELISVLTGLAGDENCRVVLISSSGSVFCQGVDFFTLIQTSSDKRMAAALEMAYAIKDFIKAVAMFSKPMVAGVHGPAVGLGATMLPFFDLVFASGQATFHTPYARLGQVPEGAATLTLPSLLGSSATSELLFACRKLTASDALHFGLVTRILWSDNFHDELLAIASGLALQSSQSMDATKALLRHNLMAGLETTLVSETHLLIQHWTSDECQANFNKYLHDEEQSLTLQTPT